MFQSTGEMVIALVLLAVTIFPFVYLPLKRRRPSKPPEGAPETVPDETHTPGAEREKRSR